MREVSTSLFSPPLLFPTSLPLSLSPSLPPSLPPFLFVYKTVGETYVCLKPCLAGLSSLSVLPPGHPDLTSLAPNLLWLLWQQSPRLEERVRQFASTLQQILLPKEEDIR